MASKNQFVGNRFVSYKNINSKTETPFIDSLCFFVFCFLFFVLEFVRFVVMKVRGESRRSFIRILFVCLFLDIMFLFDSFGYLATILGSSGIV